MNRTILRTITSSLLVASLLAAGTALAEGPEYEGSFHWDDQGMGMGVQMHADIEAGMHAGVMGTVTSINGSTLTISAKGMRGGKPGWMMGSSTAQGTTTFSVDASSATVYKNDATTSLSSIALGDIVSVQGSISGTTITATSIRDGMPMGKPGTRKHEADTESSTSPQAAFPQGNGQPVVGGMVAAVSTSTITMQNKSVTYTVNAASSTVFKANATSSIAAIAVGDAILVQGAVNGTSITATSIIDQGVSTTSGNTAHTQSKRGLGSVFGGLGNLFRALFGFF